MSRQTAFHVVLLAATCLWQSTARAEALEGRVTSVGIEEVDDQAYLVLTLDSEQDLATPQCPRADRVMVAPLTQEFGRHLAKLAGEAMTRAEVVVVTLGACDDRCYGRRRVRSLVLRRQGLHPPGMLFP